MAEPNVRVLGVYRLNVTVELFREQFEILYGYPMTPEERTDAEQQCKDQLESVVLVELVVSNRDDKFHLHDFEQAKRGQPEENWQVAWAEAYLASDGESLLVERWSDAPADDPL